MSRAIATPLLLALATTAIVLLAMSTGAQAEVTYPHTGTSLGPEGVGTSGFEEVLGVTVQQSTGDVFVLENNRSTGGRVYKFDSGGEPVDFSSTGTNYIQGVGTKGNAEEEIAVDDSSSSDTGEIYVANGREVRIYSEAGAYLGALTGPEPCGVAVDPSGNVYVGDFSEKSVKRYAPSSDPITGADQTGSMSGLGPICNVAVDSSGDLYAADWEGGVTKYGALQWGSLSATGEAVDGAGRTLAVDPSSGEVLVDEQSNIAEYDGSNEPPKRLGSSGNGELIGSYGVGVDHASAKLYAGNRTSVDILGPRTVIAGASTEAATNVTTSKATLNGTVEPAGTEVTSCVFEYGTQAGSLNQSAPCEPAPPYTGTGAEAVTASISGLNFDTTYHYRIVASGTGGPATGAEETFTTNGPKISGESASNLTGTTAELHATVEPQGVEVTGCVFEYGTERGALTQSAPCEPPSPYTGEAPVAVTAHLAGLSVATTYVYRVAASASGGTVEGSEVIFTTKGPKVSEEYIQSVSATTAEVHAKVEPRGEVTNYEVEYGPSAEYGSSTSPVSVGGGEGATSITATLTELQPETTYHLRVVATNASGSIAGPDLTVTTHGLATSGLPDDRGWELVTPVQDEGASEPYVPAGTGWSATEEYNVYSQFPVAGAADGNALSYVAGPRATGNGSQGQGRGNQFIARRAPDGEWTQTEMQPSGYKTPYFTGFSANLEAAVLASQEPIDGQGPPAHYQGLYTWHEGGSFTPFFTTKPPNRSEGAFGAFDPTREYSESLTEGYAGASADSSHQLFTANDALNGEAVDPSEEANNLYDSVDGEPQSVNVLPDGNPAPNAAFGAPSEYGPKFQYDHTGPNFSHVISADGSRVFWTDLSTGSLYVREDGTSTRLIAEGATYLTASADGGKVLYTNEAGELYEYDLATETTEDLEPKAELVGLVGAGEDLGYIYFVGRGKLVAGAEAGKENLYLLHSGETRHIATLGTGREEEGQYLETEGRYVTPWAPEIGLRMAEVTSSGRDLTFMSTQSLTGYDNLITGASSGALKAEEVFVYDAEDGALSCASCDPSGVRPAKPPLANAGGFFPLSEEPSYQINVMSEDGGRVFFESAEPLLPHATNGLELNVYEWERDGSGGCHDASGCLYLLSTGSNEDASYLLAASVSGDDVFVETRSQLVSQDENEYNDIYDAHVGAVPPPQAPLCSGTGCQGVPASPPVFATPASNTYNGVGNFAPQAKATKPKKKSKVTIKKKGCAGKKTVRKGGKRAGRAARKCRQQKRRHSKHAGSARRRDVQSGNAKKGSAR